MSVMMPKKITPCLWFDHRMGEAVDFYIALFGGEILDRAEYGEGAPQPKGTPLTITFTLQDEKFLALNGGPHYKFTEAVSFMVSCKDQAEVDKYWNALTTDGGQESMCGWCKDRWGLSWQIVPEVFPRLISHKDPVKAKRAMQAMMQMRKLDIAALEKAVEG